jgi:hypothetical protein
MGKKLTHDTLPQGVTTLLKELREFKNLFIQKQEHTPTEQPEKWLDLNDLILYDPENRTKPTWYSKISRNEVPHYKRGKKLYFLKSEIDEWLRQGKCKSNVEIEQEAEAYLTKLKRNRNV